MRGFPITRSLILFFIILASFFALFGVTGELSSQRDSYFPVNDPSNPPYTVAAKTTGPHEVVGPFSIVPNSQTSSVVLGNLSSDSPATASWTINNAKWGLLPGPWKATSLWKILIANKTPISGSSTSAIEVKFNSWKLLEANTSFPNGNYFTLDPADYQIYSSKSSVVDLKNMMAVDVPSQVMQLQNVIEISVGTHTEWHLSYILIYTEWLREPWSNLYVKANESSAATSALERHGYGNPDLVLDPSGSSCTCVLNTETLQVRSSTWSRVGSTVWSKIP